MMWFKVLQNYSDNFETTIIRKSGKEKNSIASRMNSLLTLENFTDYTLIEWMFALFGILSSEKSDPTFVRSELFYREYSIIYRSLMLDCFDSSGICRDIAYQVNFHIIFPFSQNSSKNHSIFWCKKKINLHSRLHRDCKLCEKWKMTQKLQ